MMVRSWIVSFTLALALAGMAPAQQPPTGDNPPRKFGNPTAVDRDRAEDLQILSTIVTENVNGLYGVESRRVAGGNDATGPTTGSLSATGAWLYVAGGHSLATSTPSRALAEYLPDYGVIVQMEVAPPREPVTKKTGQAEKPRPPSRWERTRQRLAGDEKQTAFERSMCSSCHDADVRHYGGKGHNDYDGDGRVDLYVDYAGGGHPAPTRKQLIEQLIETLAENGHNLRNLSADDRVTLSVSWQPPVAVADSYRALKGYFYEPSGKTNADDKSKTGEPSSPTSPAKEGADPGGGSSPRSSAELSGDLLLAKGQFAEAAKSFQQALDGLRAAGDDGPSKKEARERALTLKLAYARAHSTVQPEGAPTATTAHQQLTAVSEYEKLLTTYAPRQSPRRPDVGGRLSVTATKRQLEDVAAGKISREQFAQQVQTRGFHPAAAK